MKILIIVVLSLCLCCYYNPEPEDKGKWQNPPDETIKDVTSDT
jgi:hypothetical protein